MLCITLLLLRVNGTYAQLTVSTAPTATSLVQTTLLGAGVNASNITFSGSTIARGTFNCLGPCNVGLSSGVLLTSGSVASAIGPNNSTGAGASNGVSGDPDLNALNPTGGGGFDASVLEFDFTVATDSVRFRYVWASEEYSDFVNTGCNDYFGFFISGPGITGTENIAKIPGSTVPISINTVNNGQSAALTTPTGPCLNCAYFRDNHGSSSVQYDGMTTVLTAAREVCPCETYHIKLAVQDFCDGNYDSGVFLESNSFQSVGQIPVLTVNNQVANVGDTLYICPGDSIPLHINTCRPPFWSTGETTDSIWVSQPGIYYVSLNNGALCFAFSALIYVEFLTEQPVITASGPTNLCPGDDVTLTVSQGNSYLWSNGATTQSITVQTTNNYFCTVQYGQGSNCTAVSDTVSVQVFPNPAPGITASGPTSICQGSSVNLSVPAGNTVAWSNGSTSPSISVNTSGTYTVTVTDNNGCSGNASQSVVVNPLPAVLIAGTLSICDGSTTTLSSSGVFSSYNWSNGSTQSAITIGTSGNYVLTVTDNNGCSNSSSVQLVVLPFTQPQISGPAGFCNGSTATLNVQPGYATTLWSNGASSTANQISIGGTYAVTVTAANGCSGNANANILSWPLPSASIAGDLDICDGQTAVATAVGPAGSTFLWSNGSTAPSQSSTVPVSYSLTVTDNNGCTATSLASVTVTAAPQPQISGDDRICDGETSILTAGNGYAGYQWSSGGSSASVGVNLGGTYSVVVTDNNGCTGQTQFLVQLFPLPNSSITGPAGVCEGLTGQLQAVAGQGTYNWSNGNTGTSIQVTQTGNYSVTVTSPEGCIASESVLFQAYPIPQAIYTPVQETRCDQISVEFLNQSICEPSSTYDWKFGDGSTSSVMSPLHGYPSPGDYVTSLTVTSPYGCTDVDSAIISVILPPAPDAGFDASARIISIFNSEVSFTNTSTNATRYKWNFGEGESSEEVNPIHLFDKIGTRTVKLIAFNGVDCKDEYTFDIEVAPFFIPSAFSPNNDGRNDLFFDGTPFIRVKSFDMVIYNRWGQIVYQSKDFLRPWDGTDADGSLSPIGIYTYRIDIVSLKDKPYQYTGTFSLIR